MYKITHKKHSTNLEVHNIYMKNVILVHGLYANSTIMKYISNKLKKEGYSVKSFNYNSLNFKNSVNKLKSFVSQKYKKNENVYFVGHSLGGLLIRDYFTKYKPEFNDTCIVTIGTPHSGAEVARHLSKHHLSFMLGTSSSILKGGLQNGITQCKVGCIIGTYNLGIGSLFNLKNGDGTVTLSDAKYKHATENVYLHLNHTSILYSPETVKHICRFIEHKSFHSIQQEPSLHNN